MNIKLTILLVLLAATVGAYPEMHDDSPVSVGNGYILTRVTDTTNHVVCYTATAMGRDAVSTSCLRVGP